jgi:hypothetical protein
MISFIVLKMIEVCHSVHSLGSCFVFVSLKFVLS